MPARSKHAKHQPPPAQESPKPKRIHAVPVTDEFAQEPEETLADAEREIGLNEWIDPETGEPAEGQSPPRLEDD